MKHLMLTLCLLTASCRGPLLEVQTPPGMDQEPFGAPLAALMARAPLDAPVDVVFGPIDAEVYGRSSWSFMEQSYRIEIQGDLTHEVAMDTLVHEWAHCLVHGACHESPHDALWGVAYARAYRAIIGE